MKYFYSALICLFAFTLPANAQKLRGLLADDLGSPVPFANIFVSALGVGTSTNVDGVYELSLPKGECEVSFRAIGYQVYQANVTMMDSDIELNVRLNTQHYSIPEIKILASGEDPAYYIIRRAIAMAPYYKSQVSKYSCKVYLKGSTVLNKIPKLLKKTLAKEGVKQDDTQVTETISTINFELPDILKQEIVAMHSSGKQSKTNPMPYIVYNLYDSEKYEIVSPIGKNALHVYNFKLAGVYEENGRLINKIRVVPKQKSNDVFDGFIYIADGFWNVRSAELSMTPTMGTVSFRQVYSELASNTWMPATMDFDVTISAFGFKVGMKYVASISDYKITLNPQLDHSFLEKENELLKQEQMLLDSLQTDFDNSIAEEHNKAEIAEMMQSEQLSNQQAKKLNRLIKKETEKSLPPEPIEIKPRFISDQKKVNNDSAYWNELRPVPLAVKELDSFTKKDSFLIVSAKPEYKDSVQNAKRKFKVSHLVFGKQYNYSVDSINKQRLLKYSGFSVFSLGHNTVEGMQIPLSFSYFTSDSTGKAWELATRIKYSFSSKMLNPDIQYWKRFNGLTQSKLNIGIGSGVVDFNSNSSFSDMVNGAYILYFEQNFKKYYHRNYLRMAYQQDLANGLNAGISLLYRDSRAEINRNDFKFFDTKNRFFSPNIPLNTEIGNDLFVDRQEAIIGVKLEYTPHYRYIIRNNVKRNVESKYPTFTFQYKKSIPNFLKSDGDFDYVELGICQHLNFGISERFNYQLNAGSFLNNKRVFFESYRHFDTHSPMLVVGSLANSFRLLPFYEYSVANAFLEGHAIWDSRKLVLKQIPFLANTSLVESLYFNYLNTNQLRNYCELGYGVKNIFLFTSIEFVAGFKNGKYDSAGIKLILNLP